MKQRSGPNANPSALKTQCATRRLDPPAGKRLNSSMPHQTEPSANNAMGSLLQGMLSRRQASHGGVPGKELKPACLADADPNRALLDRRVVCDPLGFDEDIYVGMHRLAAKWCAEPSVHGGKSRPREAKLVV